MTAMEQAFRKASQGNPEFTAVVEASAAKAAARRQAEAEAAAKAAAEAALKERRKALQSRVQTQNELTLFGFSYSPDDYAMRYGVIWAASLEDAKRKLGVSKARVWELDRSSDVVIVGEYYE